MDYGGHYVGEVVNGKTLTGYAGKNAHYHHLWMWECPKCGEERGPSTFAHLKRNSICNECRNVRENNPRWKGHEQLTGVFLGYYQASAAKRGLSWEVTPEYLWSVWEAQGGFCAYTGWSLVHGETASIDRIDSSKGYIEGNVHWVHRDVNWMKGAYSEEQFLMLCRAVADFTKK